MLLFAPPALTGMMLVQYFFSLITRPDQRAYLERAALDGLSLFFVLGLILLNMAGIGSAYLCFLGGGASMITIIVNDIFLVGLGKIESMQIAGHKRVHPLTYLTLSLLPAIVGSEGEF